MRWLLVIILSTHGAVRAATIAAASPSYSDVTNAIASASHGDTVTVPSGSVTWNSTLLFTKAITLLATNSTPHATKIKVGSPAYIIEMTPSTNLLHRISGFTFDASDKQVMQLSFNGTQWPPYNKIRIDHNHFTNAPTSSGGAIYNAGLYGCIDNNTFTNMHYPLRIGDGYVAGGGSVSNWINLPDLDFGANEDNMWVEDCSFEINGVGGQAFPITDSDAGGRWGLRYNTFASEAGGHFPWSDIHGGRGTLYSSMGGIMYGNNWTQPSGGGSTMNSWRGGRFLAFYNSTEENGSLWWIYNNTGCPPEPHADRQDHNNGHYFGNRIDKTGIILPVEVSTQTNCHPILEGLHWFSTNYVGMQTSLPGSGTNLQFMWVPVAGQEDSLTNLTDYVGSIQSNPSRKTIAGSYHRWTNSAWVTVFASLPTYPHPLREESSANSVTIHQSGGRKQIGGRKQF